MESLTANVARLKAYRERLILFPRRAGQHKKTDSSKEEVESHKEGKIVQKTSSAFPVQDASKANAISEVSKSEMGEGESAAYRRLRDARSDARLVGVREKRAKAKADEASAAKK